ALQLEGQPRGKLFARRFGVAGLGLWQKQARLQIGEPSRHDEIIGGQLEPEPPRLADKSQILVGERQNGDLLEVDLLRARQRQQQIERSLEAFDIDDEIAVDPGLARKHRLEGIGALLRLIHHASSSDSFCLPAATSKGLGLDKRASAASARTAEAPDSSGTAP